MVPIPPSILLKIKFSAADPRVKLAARIMLLAPKATCVSFNCVPDSLAILVKFVLNDSQWHITPLPRTIAVSTCNTAITEAKPLITPWLS